MPERAFGRQGTPTHDDAALISTAGGGLGDAPLQPPPARPGGPVPSGVCALHAVVRKARRSDTALPSQKDPRKRPSAKALLGHRFFKEMAQKPVSTHALPSADWGNILTPTCRRNEQDFLIKTLLEGIPPLGERVRILRERENARRGAVVENDIKSQTECVVTCRRPCMLHARVMTYVWLRADTCAA